MLASSPHLAEALQKVTTVAQLVLLVPTGGSQGPSGSGGGTGDGQTGAAEAEAAAAAQGAGGAPPLVVVNTHLFFHPFAPHIRSMHVAAMLEEAAAAMQVDGRA
jgi:2',5'-phosphodiesterase